MEAEDKGTAVVVIVCFGAAGLFAWFASLDAACVALLSLYAIQEVLGYHLTNAVLRAGGVKAELRLLARRKRTKPLAVVVADTLVVAAAFRMLFVVFTRG